MCKRAANRIPSLTKRSDNYRDNNTHVTFSTSYFSNIDLSVVSPSLKHEFEWSVYGELLGSDHYPVILETITPFRSTALRNPKWILETADWESFKTLSRVDRRADSFESLGDMMEYFENVMLRAAGQSIPVTFTEPRHISVPWWNANKL